MFKNILILCFVILICLNNFSAGREAEKVTLTGKIEDPNGRAVIGALINVLPNMDDNDQKYMVMFSVKEPVKTGAEGKYEVPFNPNEYGPVRGDYFDLYVRNLDRNLVAIQKFNKGSRMVDVTLSSGIILTGRIVDVNENPVPNASLSFLVPSSNRACIFNFEKNCPVSDRNGHYEIRALWPEKQYSVSINVDGYGTGTVDGYFIDDTFNHTIELETVVLKKADMSISGSVVDDSGKPVANAKISCYGDCQPSRRTESDAEGKFTLENVCAGEVVINVNKTDSKLIKRMRGSIKTEGGRTDVRIVVSDISSRSSRRQQPSLISKPLPDINELNVEISSTEIENKKILICFFDMNQRPSRNCLSQLAKRVKELKEKGIKIVPVQATKIDKNSLAEWIEENDISFPVGMIRDDVEKTRFNWGVKSLPWLILTDKDNIVRAEGFAISELEEKIKQVSGD